MPLIQRVLPAWHGATPGPHIFGDITVEFDEAGLAVVDDPAVLEIMQDFPGTFHVVEEGEEPPPALLPEAESRTTLTPPPEPVYTSADLEAMTVWNLQEVATRLSVSGVRSMRKQDLVEAILEAQVPSVTEDR